MPEASPRRVACGWRLCTRALLLSVVLASLTTCADGAATGSVGLPAVPDAYDHGLAPGASARDLLSSTDFTRLIVQVQYVEDFRPTDAGLQILRAFLDERLNKPAGIVIQIDPPLQIQRQATYSAVQARAIEAAHRTAYTDGTTLAAYLLFLDGEYASASNVLGIAYNNTSMAVFAETLAENSGGPLQPSPPIVEGAVANHEFGHLMGLVNNGSAMQLEHQDEPNENHCDEQTCLMYYAVRTTDFISNLMGGIPALDQNCIDDLRANGGK